MASRRSIVLCHLLALVSFLAPARADGPRMVDVRPEGCELVAFVTSSAREGDPQAESKLTRALLAEASYRRAEQVFVIRTLRLQGELERRAEAYRCQPARSGPSVDEVRAHDAAIGAAYPRLAAAIRETEEGKSELLAREAFALLERDLGGEHPTLAQTRLSYADARRRCQRDDACDAFGDPPASHGLADLEAAVASLRKQGRFEEAARMVASAAVAAMGGNPAAAHALIPLIGARMVLFDLGKAEQVLPSLTEIAKATQSFAADRPTGFMQTYFVDASQVARAYRMLALAELAAKGRSAAANSYAIMRRYAQQAAPDLEALSEGWLLALGMGDCASATSLAREASARLEDGQSVVTSDIVARSLDLATALSVCASPRDAAPELERALARLERLLRENGSGELSPFAALTDRLAYLGVSLALAEPSSEPLRELALRAVLLRSAPLATQGPDEALRDASLDEELALQYGALARETLEDIAQQAGALPARLGASWWQLRARAASLERLRNRARSRAPLPSRAALERALGDEQALLVYVRYVPYALVQSRQDRPWGAERYAAFALRREGGLALRDLGPAQEIERDLGAYLHGLEARARGAKAVPTPLPAQLHDRVLGPIAAAFPGALPKSLIVAADAALVGLPFVALEHAGKPLLDQGYTVRYLSSGAELAERARVSKGSSEPSLIFFHSPDFGPATGLDVLHSFAPLEGTRVEAQGVLTAWQSAARSAVEKGGEDATRAALLGVQPATVLHVATHGWFLPERRDEPSSQARLFLGRSAEPELAPSLRTGLALAGANASRTEGNVTALELSALRLPATQLVVLSACDSAKGVVRPGQGALGLHRAFLASGAETVVGSLWKVSDEATAHLMHAYYRELLAGADRIDALHRAARSLRAQAPTRDPAYWAAFVAYGRAGALQLPPALAQHQGEPPRSPALSPLPNVIAATRDFRRQTGRIKVPMSALDERADAACAGSHVSLQGMPESDRVVTSNGQLAIELHPPELHFLRLDSAGNFVRDRTTERAAVHLSGATFLVLHPFDLEVAASGGARTQIVGTGTDARADAESIYLFDARNGRPRGELVGHRAPIRTVVYSETGRHLASLDTSGELRAWPRRVEPAQEIARDAVWFAFAGDDRIAYLRKSGEALVWNVAEGRPERALHGRGVAYLDAQGAFNSRCLPALVPQGGD